MYKRIPGTLMGVRANPYAVASSLTHRAGIGGTLSHHECWLREAIVRFPLRMANSTVLLASMRASEY